MTLESFYGALVEDDPEELYENAPCGYLSTLPDGTIVKANQTFLRWTGLGREVVGRRRFQELLAPGDRIYYETHVAPLLRMQGSVREIAVDLRVAYDQRLPALVNAVLKTAEDGTPQLVRIAVFDARERRAYEQELLESRRRAEASEARARALAQTLQSTFVPPVPAAIPGLDVAAEYRPAGDGSEVGGDFYDVFALGLDTYGVLLGDVSGKGVAAAVVTALVRHTVRAEALRSRSPADTFGLVHEALLTYHPDFFCTALLLELRISGEEPTITMSVAGHDLPLRVRGGRAEPVGEPGALLGMVPGLAHDDVTLPLERGDVLVLYTDGVPEARNGGGFFGHDRLRALATDLAGRPATEVASAIVATVLDFQGGHARDDIAVVVLRRD